MRITKFIGGFEYAAIIGDGTNGVSKGTVRVEGPGLNEPAEYIHEPIRLGKRYEDAATVASDAIRYTVDNIVFPLALADALRLREAA